MYAVIETGGKQYRVQEGDVITVEKLNVLAGDSVEFDKVLVLSDGKTVQVGTPIIETAKVYGSVVENGKGQKVIIFKYKSKKDYRKKQGHRQPYTMIKIDSLSAKPTSTPKKAVVEKPEVTAEKVVKPAVEKVVKPAVEKSVTVKKPATKKTTEEKTTKSAAEKKPVAKKAAKPAEKIAE